MNLRGASHGNHRRARRSLTGPYSSGHDAEEVYARISAVSLRNYVARQWLSQVPVQGNRKRKSHSASVVPNSADLNPVRGSKTLLSSTISCVIDVRMANSFAASRAQLVFALCLPIAVLLGYLLAEPGDFSNILLIGIMVFVLSIPVLMYWYHPLLIFTWNAAITPIFLPGQPFLWMLFAFLGFVFAIVNRFTSAEARLVQVPNIARSLLFMTVAVLGTAVARGGLGMRIFGSGQYGGKGYYYIMAAILGFFALISKRIPKHRANLFVGIFFIVGLTSLVPNIAYLAGPKFEFLFYIFPALYAYEQASGDFNIGADFARVYGLTFGSNALYCWILVRYGLKGVFDFSKPFRFLLFLLAALGSFFCGFRSFLILFLLTLGAQFFSERLHRTRAMGISVACALACLAVLLPVSDRLPLVVQRSIAFLPIKLNPAIKANAQASSDWRVDMWKEVMPEIPQYLLLGKGYKVNPVDLDFARRGYGPSYNWASLTGAYHNGPLTLLIPFGLWGFAAFTWFLVASFRYLYRAYKSGDSDLKSVNTFLLAYFAARTVYFLFVFGNFYTDLFFFTGIIGISVSLNGALEEPPQEEESQKPEDAHAEEFAALAER